tara:strand:+ start:575 stop:967 length:393 start_codon:yes stop_codon:yes gene_type:complete
MDTLAKYHANNLPELMEKIRTNGIGLDDYLNRFWDESTKENYPPYNLIQLNNHESTLEIALAGFKKDDLKVFTEFGKLHVEGKKETSETDGTFVHKGLAQRSFKRVWTVSDDTKVGSVKFEGRTPHRTVK